MLLDELARKGLSVVSKDDKLLVSPERLLDTETDSLIRENKLRLLGELRVARYCEQTGENPIKVLAEIVAAAGPDWMEVACDPMIMETVARSVVERRYREQGTKPPSYSQTSDCRHCGRVWTPEGYQQQIETCPWCRNRIKGYPIPRP